MLANVYLHQVDRVWDTRRYGVLVRYADDVVVMCRTRQQAEDALAFLRAVLGELGLTPKASKTGSCIWLTVVRVWIFWVSTIDGCAVRDVRAPKGLRSLLAGHQTRRWHMPGR